MPRNKDSVSIPGWKEGAESDIVLRTDSEFRRNLSGFPFSPKLGVDALKELSGMMRGAMAALGTVRNVDSMEPRDRKILRDASILNGFKPGDRRMLCTDASEWRWCMALGAEHLTVHARAPGLSVEESLESARAWEKLLEETLDFAFSLDIGYLLSDIAASGNGLFHQALVFLPALGWTGKREAIFRSLMKEGYGIRGIVDGGNEHDEELFEIGTEISCGMTEEESANKFAHMLRLLVHYERKARETLDDYQLVSLRDRVFRAWALAASAEKMGYREAKETVLSLVLGVSFGLLKADIVKLIELFWLSGDAFIRSGGDGAPERVRPKLVRTRLGIGKIIGGDDV